MKLNKLVVFAAAASLVATPVLAQSVSQPVQAQKTQVERVNADEELASASKLGGENGALIGILAFAAVVGGVFLIAESSDPSSP